MRSLYTIVIVDNIQGVAKRLLNFVSLQIQFLAKFHSTCMVRLTSEMVILDVEP